MLPELFRIGPIALHSFGLMMALAFAAAVFLALPEFRRRKLDPDLASEVAIGAMVGGVLGAKLYFIFDHWDEFLLAPGRMFFSGAGLTWYGGFIGGVLGSLLLARLRRIPLLVLCDIAAPILGFSYAVGRTGCLLNGDDYGRPATVPWAMTFPKGTPPTLVPVHPTQVYEILGGLFIFFLLNRLKFRLEARPGALFGLYLVLAGFARFVVEYYRMNEAVAVGLTMAQLISLGLVGVGLLFYLRKAAATAGLQPVAP